MLRTETERRDPALSTAPCIGGLGTEGERQAPVKLPNAERGLSAVHAEDRGDTAPTSEKRKAQPPEPTRKVLRTETERRDLSTAPSTVERSTEGERQPPEYMPTAVSQLTAAQTEDGGGDATASEPQPTSPLGSTRTMLCTEREHRDSSVSLEGPSDGQRASFGQPSPEISALEEQAEMQHRLDDQARQLREPREAITTSAPDGPSEMESSEGDENSVTQPPSTSEAPASLPPPMLPTPLPPSPHPGGGVVVTAPTSTDANEQA